MTAGEQNPIISGGPDFLDTLARGLHVMTILGGNSGGSISDIARASGLSKPSVRRVLHTLCSLGYASDSGRSYELTPQVTRLAAAYLGTAGKSRVLQTQCEKASAACGEIVLGAVLDGFDQLNVAFATPPNFVGYSQGIGSRLPAYRTAAGRVMLGQLADAKLGEFLEQLEPQAITPLTLVDKGRLKSAIVATRKSGHCIVDGESFIEFKTIAYPIYLHDGRLFGALSINARKTPELTEDKFTALRKLCKSEAALLSSMLV